MPGKENSCYSPVDFYLSAGVADVKVTQETIEPDESSIFLPQNIMKPAI